jgi:hypothetical protein
MGCCDEQDTILCLLCALCSCRWDEQNALLVDSHERVIKDLTEEAEAKLAVEVLSAQTLRQEKEVLLKEASEVCPLSGRRTLYRGADLVDIMHDAWQQCPAA